MIRYLLDTNIISEVRKPRPHGGVLAWIAGLREDQLYVSPVTTEELQRGVEQARSKDKTKALAIESWADQLEITSNVIPMNGTCFREWARLMEGKSDYLLEDAMIAATASSRQPAFVIQHLPMIDKPIGFL